MSYIDDDDISPTCGLTLSELYSVIVIDNTHDSLHWSVAITKLHSSAYKNCTHDITFSC